MLFAADTVGLVGRIEMRTGCIDRQAAGAGAHFLDAGGGHGPRGTVHLKNMDSAAVPGREVHLGRQDVFQR